MKNLFNKKNILRGEDMSKYHERYTETNEELGKGSYGEVREVKDAYGNVFAVKTLQKGKMIDGEENTLAELYNEVDIMQNLDHENIVKMYGVYEDKKVFKIVMEKAAGIDLYDYLMETDTHSETDTKRLVRSLTEALKYCYDKGVVHRDVKPENILLGEKNSFDNVKLIDFGLSVQLGEEEKNDKSLETRCGSMSYVAPEILLKQKYNYKCDIWSLGLIAYILCSGGYHPYDQGNRKQTKRNACRGVWTFGPKDAWVNVSAEAKDFITGCLTKNPDDRLDYEQLLQHEWINGDDVLAPTKIRRSFGRKSFAVEKLEQDLPASHIPDINRSLRSLAV